MNSRSDVIHGLLFCRVQSRDGEIHSNLLRELDALLSADPELRVKIEARRETIVLLGDDELQLERAGKRIQSSRDLEIGAMQITYLEAPRGTAEGEGKYIRQIGGSGNYGHAKVRIEPNEPGKGYEFINEIKGGVVPKEYVTPIDQGIQGALELGILAGFPVVDVKVSLYGGSYHKNDSNEMAFRFAGSMAFKDAAKKASPVLLEPVMAVEVMVPEESMGTIIADINSRRGRIEGMEHAAGSQVIRAIVPLAELLSSSPHGRSKYAMHFAGYEPRPPRGGSCGDDAPVSVRKPSAPSSRSSSVAAEFED